MKNRVWVCCVVLVVVLVPCPATKLGCAEPAGCVAADYANFVIPISAGDRALGCSDNVPLRGKVVYSDNGEPVPRGLVMLESGTHMSRGEIQSDGTFVISSLKARDGIPPGDYRISIAGAVETYEMATPRAQRAVSRVKWRSQRPCALSL